MPTFLGMLLCAGMILLLFLFSFCARAYTSMNLPPLDFASLRYDILPELKREYTFILNSRLLEDLG